MKRGSAGPFVFTVSARDEFKIAVRAVLEHHLQSGKEFCGDWCVSATGTAEEIERNGLRFRSKCATKELYLVMKTHHEQFMEDEKLVQLFHQYDTNIGRGVQQFLISFFPRTERYVK
jgi:hypothetical protein